MSKIIGGCLCGEIRYESASEPVFIAICNCKNCQKQSGSAFAVNIAIPKETLKYKEVEPTFFEDRGSSGLPVFRRFCANCGSPIFSEVIATPNLIWLKAGTLDDTSWVKPQIAMFCKSAMNWTKMPTDLPQYPENPPANLLANE